MPERIDTKAVDQETLDFLVEHADWFSRLRRLQDAGNYSNDDGEQLLDNIGFRSIVEMTSHLARARNALAQEIAQQDALWEHCHIVYWPPGQPLAYPIEHNLAAKKDNRRAIEAAIAAETER